MSMMGAYELNISSHDNKVTMIASGSEVGLALSTQDFVKKVQELTQKLFQCLVRNCLITK